MRYFLVPSVCDLVVDWTIILQWGFITHCCCIAEFLSHLNPKFPISLPYHFWWRTFHKASLLYISISLCSSTYQALYYQHISDKHHSVSTIFWTLVDMIISHYSPCFISIYYHNSIETQKFLIALSSHGCRQKRGISLSLPLSAWKYRPWCQRYVRFVKDKMLQCEIKVSLG